MAKSKERLDAEATHSMTSKQKLSNFWFYYKWWLCGGGIALIMGGLLVRDVVNNVKPDYTIGILTPYTIQETTLTEMKAAILPYIDDRNGDGKTELMLSTYSVSLGEEQTGDPMMHAAAVTRLSGDIQMYESLLFMTDDVEGYQKNMDLFCYNDGTDTPMTGDVDYAQMGVPFADCPPLSSLDTSKISPRGFVLVKRATAEEQLAKAERADYYADSMRLFDALTTD